METVEKRVDSLEEAMKQLAQAQMETQQSLRLLAEDSRRFTAEMLEFKDEMGEFKDEMRVFKDEMRAFQIRVDRDIEESRRDRREMNKRWGELANKMGTIVEDIVAPAIRYVAKDTFGISNIETYAVRAYRTHSTDPSNRREFDGFLFGDGKFIINETKSAPNSEKIGQYAELLKDIHAFFPEYREAQLIPIFSSLYLSDDLVARLTKLKIFGLATKGDQMEILNPQLLKK